MSEKLSDLKVEEVSAGYEAPEAQTGNESGQGIVVTEVLPGTIATVASSPVTVAMPSPNVAAILNPAVNVVIEDK